MKSIRGKRAFVTGAASGIGREIALQLALEGVHVYLLDIDAGGLASVVRDARVCGVDAVGIRCDLTEPTQISDVIANMLSEWGPIDILVNNAGVAFYGPTEKMTSEQWDWLLAINLLAPILITQRVLPTLLSRPEAHILNVCSIAGLVAGARSAAYHTSKFGLVGFTEALRAIHRRGIGVTCLCPGPVRTSLYRSAVSGKKNRPVVPDPPFWITMSAERVATVAIRAILKNKRLIVLTPLAHLLYNANRFTPWLIDWLHHVVIRRRRRPEAETLRPFNPDVKPAIQDDTFRRAA